MTQSTFALPSLLASIVVLFTLSAPLNAAVFCVDSAVALLTALTSAQSNGEDDQIQIVQGTYVGNFVYASTQADGLTVQGGWTSGCTSREIDPANTVLDGDQTGTVLVLSAPNGAADLLLHGVTLRNGRALTDGGGLFARVAYDGSVTIEFNTIQGNLAYSHGGGVYVHTSSGELISVFHNTIQGNIAEYGGGVYVDGSIDAINITNNTFQSGLYSYSDSIHVWANCETININNNALRGYGMYGGGVYFYGSSTNTINIANNTIQLSGGRGLHLRLYGNSTSANVYNNLFWDNTSGVSADIRIDNDEDGDYIPSPVTLLHNNFDQTPGTGFYITLPITIDPSNLDKVDPLFVDAENGDLSLLPGSPMIDAGYPGTPDLPEFDIAGTPRVLGESVDIGAYEFDDGSDPRGILFIQSDGTGSGTVTSNPEGIDCGADCAHAFVLDTPVTLTGTPDAKSVFDGWSGDPDCLDGQLVMDGNRSCTATFNAVRQLTTTKAGEGDGTLTSTPAGIDCGSACSAYFYLDESVALTATPDAQSLFTGWSGDPMCPDPVLDQDRACTATFDPILYRLFVIIGGDGTGTVTSDPEGIDCDLGCEADFRTGTRVVLTAVADPGSVFEQWAGPCHGTNPVCEVTLSASRAAAALFAPAVSEFPLTVTKTGTGAGTVASIPAGIDCGDDCTASYTAGTSVQLTATPTAGSRFSGWSGACSGTGDCNVTLDAARNVAAGFDLAGGGACPAQTTVAGQPNRAGWLHLLYRVRDNVLAQSAQGRELIDLYYRHSSEVRKRLMTDPRLALQALDLLRLLRADMEAATTGTTFTLKPPKRAAIRTFANQLRTGASPALAKDLKRFNAQDLDAVLKVTKH